MEGGFEILHILAKVRCHRLINRCHILILFCFFFIEHENQIIFLDRELAFVTGVSKGEVVIVASLAIPISILLLSVFGLGSFG